MSSARCTQDIWGDNDINPIQYHKWTSADNEAIIAVYTRCMKGITLVNEFLVKQLRMLASRGHEAFQRLLINTVQRQDSIVLYTYLLWTSSEILHSQCPNTCGDLPEQIGRTELFKWIEGEA